MFTGIANASEPAHTELCLTTIVVGKERNSVSSQAFLKLIGEVDDGFGQVFLKFLHPVRREVEDCTTLELVLTRSRQEDAVNDGLIVAVREQLA